MTGKAPHLISRQSAVIIVVLLAAEFTSAFELTMIYSGMKTFIAIFESPAGAGWLITSYLLVGSAAAAICGRLGDLFGRKRMLLISLGLATIGSLISASATELETVIAGRALQGFAGAILPLCYGLVRESLPPEDIPFGIGILAASVMVAGGVGIVAGGVLIDRFAWNSIFMLSGAMAVLSFLASWRFLPSSKLRSPTGSLDLLGGLLFVPALCMLLVGISQINIYGLSIRAPALPLLLGGALLLAIWIRHELRTANPLIDLRLLTGRNVVLANLAFCAYALGPQQGQLPLLLMQQSPTTGVGFGMSATFAGLVSLPGQLAGLMLAPLFAYFCARIGSKRILITAGGLLFLAVLSILMSVLGNVAYGPFLYFLFMGTGSVALFASAPNVIVAEAPSHRTSEATGMMQVIRSVVQAIGAQIVISLLATSTAADPVTGAGPFPTYDAYVVTAIVTCILGSGALWCGILIRGYARYTAD